MLPPTVGWPFLYGRYLDEITRDVIDEVTAARPREGVSNATVNRLLQVLRAILNAPHGIGNGWLNRPRAALPEPRTRVRWITQDEAARLVAELPPHLAEMAPSPWRPGLARPT